MTDLTVATTIRDQIKAIDPAALMAWGARQYVGSENALRFRVSGLKFRGIVAITLNGRDLYDIELGNPRKSKWVVKHSINDVYCDQLVEVLDRYIEGR